MAFVAAGTGVEERPAALGGVVDGRRVTRDEAIERGVERQLRAFIGRDGAQEIAGVGRTAEDLSEGVLVLRDGGDPGHGGVEARLAHLDGVDDRQRRLLLERLHPPVPELRLIVERVQNRRGVALADTAIDPDGGGPPVGERAPGIMAGAARPGPVRRPATVKEQILAEGAFLGGLGIVRRYRGACLGRRAGDSRNGLWLSQRASLWDRRPVQNGRTMP